ncbi:carboxypeptidase family protein [Edaphobacter aggregans]|uniref:Carboxypeptidase family protein n=1 Tax=Edaphobacter aggregans TaxID=570835 RepID=A0A3R9NZ98_9BACT|nr:TonB-dependent receptor [Edaphobacter aggregans]RSL17334.1 carboxypeptidase family protein [Edaphobacter aggregans]
MKSFSRHIYLYLLVLALAITQFLSAQTFRGGIAGTVQDSTNAVVANAKIVLLGTDTGYTRETVSTSAGAYSFQDLPLGNYSVTITAPGFASKKIDGIAVRPGQVYALDISVSVATSNEQVEVNAAAIALDTVSSTNNAVVSDKAVANIPLNGRDFTQLIKITPGFNGQGSLNGARTNQNNWQIDGADNNDLFHNSEGANQGGVSGIAGVTLPIDAIDQFSVQSQANAEVGRNAGGLINMVIKSGTNHIHGSAYYFLRNEFFASKSPILPTATRKPEIRNNQFGGSLGGPILHDKLFLFVNYERQKYVIGAQSAATEPTAAWVTQATALLTEHNIPVSPTSLNVLSLWPQGNKPSGGATLNNFFDTRPQDGYSDNVVGKLDWNLTSRQTLSVRSFIGTGRQLGNAGVNIWEYYQVAPNHVHNYAITHNWAKTDHLSNQLLAAVNYFGQTFNDNVHNQDIPALGLNTGVTNPSLFGAPTITITSFDQVGVTPPLGRQDYTGMLNDTATLVSGKHQFRLGGEFRRNYMNLLYQRNVRGSFNYDGTAYTALHPTNNYATEADGTTRALADYLAGYSTSGTIVYGTLQRDLWLNQWSIFGQDQYQLLSNLTLNYGLRWDYSGPVYSTNGTLSNFDPNSSTGFAIVGQNIDTIYPRSYTNVAPRFGFAYQAASKLAVRGTYGIYYDLPNLNGFFDNRPGNGASVGVQANNTGPNPVFTVSKSSAYQILPNINPFPTTGAATTFGVSTVDPGFRNAYVHNFNLNTQYQLGRNSIFQVSYVGALGRRLFNLIDINQAAPNSTGSTQQSTRPYFSKFPSFAAINQYESKAGSNFHSLQGMIRTSSFHGLTAQAAYTYGHSLDNVSGTRGFAPQNSLNLGGEYGNADFDTRHTFNAYAVYEVPKFTDRWKPLTSGWQGNVFTTFYTGKPINIKTSTNNSGVGEFQDRAVRIANPYTTSHTLVRSSATAGAYVQWFAPTAYALPAKGTFSGMHRNDGRGPGFGTVDASLVKNTQLHENVNLQLRAEMFNIFNRLNLANPSGSFTSTSLGRSTDTIGDSIGAPGIGSGEPFNVQFAAKIIF